ncbi:MAG: GH116 family glycosyl-hydrolase, partial [Planctomycetota bacterium]|nr:GH116 family glycosyl-hydrolase [Planctomycetota bacterium]
MRRLWMIVIIVVVCGSFLTFHNLVGAADGQDEHLVPAEKNLNRGAIQRFVDRGRPDTYTGKDLETIGMPIGGIATGQLYLRGDGTLGVWQIFNRHVFTGYGRDCYRTYRPGSPVDSGFAVTFETENGTIVEPLDRAFSNIRFTGEYPIGLVNYSDQALPVRVEMEAFSPFIPLNAKDSALPATIFHITLENTSDKAIKAGVLGWLENAVLIDSAKSILANRRTRIVDEKGRTLIVHTAEKAPPPKKARSPRRKIVLADFEGPDYGDWVVTGEAFGKAPARGTIGGQQNVTGFLGKGLVNTFLGGDAPSGTLTSLEFMISRKFINFLIGGGNHVDKTCINLLVDGKMVRTAVGKSNEKLTGHFWNVEEFKGRRAKIQIVDNARGGWGHINVDQIELSDEPQSGPVGPLEELPDYGSMVLAFAGQADTPEKSSSTRDTIFSVNERKPAQLSTELLTLTPRSRQTFTFVLSWFFPNHQNGREYANRFDSAADVAHYVLDNHERLVGETRKWHKTFYEDSTLPRWLLFRLHSTVCNLATGTCQWWGNGRFWAWEGVGCCAGTCTHVWNYAHAPARLFPELERSARQMQDFGEGFDAETGLVGFRSNRAYAADGQCGTILKAYREHLMSANDAFLKRNWPRIKKALEYTIGRDGNDDGLIEDSQHNTFDINFQGPNTFVGSLYLAALRAGEEMAKEMGDGQFAGRCRKIFESGSRLTVERLWDGEYFVQIV